MLYGCTHTATDGVKGLTPPGLMTISILTSVILDKRSIKDTIISVKRDYKAGQPALTEALNTIRDETKQHKIHKLNKLHGNICKWSQYTISLLARLMPLKISCVKCATTLCNNVALKAATHTSELVGN